MGYIELGRSGEALEQIKQNFIDGHVSYVWEDICREKMWALDFKNRWGFSINRCGKWWNKEIEIDIVAYDSLGSGMIFGECKFRSGKMGPAELRNLEQKADAVPRKNENRRNYFVLFSIGGFSGELKAVAESRGNVL
jgi:AAA+ ATPase superfamily predicted ATPase